MTPPFAGIVLPAQPARLRIGDREFPVATQPLSTEARNDRQVELVTSDPHCFLLKPLAGFRSMAWLMGLMLAGLFIFLWVLGLRAVWGGGWWGLVFFVLGLPFLAILFLMAKHTLYGKGPRQFRFDRRKGELIVERRLGLSQEYISEAVYALHDVAAIQLLYSGYHSIVHTSDSGPTTSVQFHTFEMNVVFGDAQQSRLHLCTHADWKWMRESGQKLGEFLRVPVIDQLCQGS